MKIAVFVGSVAPDSINKKLAGELEKLLPEGVEFSYADLDLPLFSADKEAEFPAAAKANKELVEAADGVLIITPEYNRSIPGALKNAIDWTSRPWGSNSFDGKPTAVAGISISPLGTAPAQQHLNSVLVYLNTKLMGQPELYLTDSRIYTEDGTLADDSRQLLSEFLAAFQAHINA